MEALVNKKKNIILPKIIKCSSIMNMNIEDDFINLFLLKNKFDVLYKICIKENIVNFDIFKKNLINTNFENIFEQIKYEDIGNTYKSKYHLIRVKNIGCFFIKIDLNKQINYNKFNKIDNKNNIIEHKIFFNIKKIYTIYENSFISEYSSKITEFPLNIKHNYLFESFNILKDKTKINDNTYNILKQSVFIEELKDSEFNKLNKKGN